MHRFFEEMRRIGVERTMEIINQVIAERDTVKASTAARKPIGKRKPSGRGKPRARD